MHTLEYMILQLSARIERETGNKALADDARTLAGATHHAFEETEDQSFLELHKRWQNAHDHVMRA